MNAYVLVGGRSRRMGSSKAGLFLERVVAAARPVFDEVILVDRPGELAIARDGVARPPGVIPGGSGVVSGAVEGSRPCEPGPASASFAGRVPRRLYEEPHEGDGAIFGVACALGDVQSRSEGKPAARAFILATDYPLITADVLRYLSDREGMPVWDGQPQPLCAVWNASVLARLEERIGARRFDLRTVGGQEMISESELRARFPGEPLMNVNTPEEWERAQRFLSSR